MQWETVTIYPSDQLTMKAKTSIVALILIFVLIAGDSTDDSRVTRMSWLQFDEWNKPFYSCQFNFEVRCMWKIKGKNIDISSYNYNWISGNGANTKDCSIKGKSRFSPKLRDGLIGDKVACIGIGYGPRRVTIGESIELQCPSPNRDKCRWTGNDGLPKNIEYSWTNDSDCTIRINTIRMVDLTVWKCIDLASPNSPIAVYTLVQQNLTVKIPVDTPTETSIERDLYTTTTSVKSTAQSPTSEIQNTNNSSPTVAVTEFPTSQIKSTTLNSTESSPTDNLTLMSSDETNSTTSTTMIAMAENSIEGTATSAVQPNQSVPTALVATIIVLSIVIVIVGVAWIFRERMKKRNTTHNDNNRHNHDGVVREAPSSTSNAHHSYDYVKASTSQTETEDDDGYLIATQLNANTNTNNTKRNSDPNNHVYATIKDDIYTNVQHPSGNSQTYTVLF